MVKINRTDRADRRIWVIVGCCVFVWFIIVIIVLIINPMRRPLFMAENYILRIVPIGTDMDEAIEILENHRNWNIAWISDRGFRHPRPHDIRPMIHSSEWPVIVGDKSIRVDVGRHWPAHFFGPGLLMEAIVSIFFGFDEDGKLTDVYVWKSAQ